ncbi:MAG: ATP synthase F1 subunit delta [Chitinophagaceae bacterium]
MRNPRLATRYAKSLLDLALERGELESAYQDMLTLQQICKGNPDFVKMISSPVIAPDKKIKIVEAITAGKVNELTWGFIRLLITKTREANLAEIVDAFITQYKQHKNIYTVKLTTATPVNDDVKNRIVEQVKATSDMQNIELETKVNENIIGGFVLQAGDKLVDASISYDLKEIANQFENNDFIYKVR